MIVKALALGLGVNFLQGMELPPYEEKHTLEVAYQEPSHPQDILLLEIWDKIFHQLKLVDQAKLARVCSTFREDFFWLPACRFHFLEALPPLVEINSLVSYVLLIYKVRLQFHAPLDLPVLPLNIEKMVLLAFKKTWGNKLQNYIEKERNAHEIIKMMREDNYPRPQYGNDHRRLYFEVFGEAGDQNCCRNLYDAAASGVLGFNLETGHTYLKERSALGDQGAQERLNFLASTNSLIGEDGKLYLETRALQGDQNAQKHLNEAAYYGTLPFTTETRSVYLEARKKINGQQAQSSLNSRILDKKVRGRSAETARSYLERLAIQGDPDAQKKLNWAVRSGELLFTLETGRLYLENRVQEGDEHAGDLLYEAAIDGELLFNLETSRSYLEKRAREGSVILQQRLNDQAFLAYSFRFSSDETRPRKFLFTPQAGRQYLKDRAKKGDRHARAWFYSLVTEKFQSQQEKIIYFFGKAKSGDILAYYIFLVLLLGEEPAQAIIFRWHFILYYTLMGFPDNPFNNEG